MPKAKKLIGLDALEAGNHLLDQGVPMSKVHEHLDLPWHYMSTRDVFKADRAGKRSITRPEWLQNGPALQEPPEPWFFDGVFPNGVWRKKYK